MECRSPTSLGGHTYVRCGRCMNCRIWRRDRWVLRLMLELHTHPKACFVTLTYDQAHVTSFLDYRHVQLFLKRFRDRGYNVRYAIVGEYGSENGRVHWHMVLYSCDHIDIDAIELQKSWQNGAVHVDPRPISIAGCRYLMKYLTKDNKNGKETIFKQSKVPALGSERAYELGDRFARAGGFVVPSRLLVAGKEWEMDRTAHKHFVRGMLNAGVRGVRESAILTKEKVISSHIRRLKREHRRGEAEKYKVANEDPHNLKARDAAIKFWFSQYTLKPQNGVSTGYDPDAEAACWEYPWDDQER